MGQPRGQEPVKLIVGLFASGASSMEAAKRALERKFGRVDRETGILDFSVTRYYEKEFGTGLKRKFLSFRRHLSAERGYRVKLFTNRAEARLSRHRRRSVNIDPGYLTLAKLVLFTTKDRSHRIYAGKGIYADLELVFRDGTFRPLEWTYPDYRQKSYIDFFNLVREKYKKDLRRGGRVESRVN